VGSWSSTRSAIANLIFERTEPRKWPRSARSERASTISLNLFALGALNGIFIGVEPSWYRYCIAWPAGCISFAAIGWFLYCRFQDARATRLAPVAASEPSVTAPGGPSPRA
jgi:hypothetical protein